MGNSIVRASQSSGATTTGGGDKAGKATQAGQTAYQEAIDSGATPQQATANAIQALAESSGGAVDLTTVTQAEGAVGKGSINGLDITQNVQVSNGEDVGQFFVDGVRTQQDADNLLAHVSNFLDQGSLPSSLNDVSLQLATRSIRGVSERQDTFYEGVARGMRNVRNSAELDSVRQNIVDLNDPDTRLAFALARYQQDVNELQVDALSVIGSVGLLVPGGALIRAGGALLKGGLTSVAGYLFLITLPIILHFEHKKCLVIWGKINQRKLVETLSCSNADNVSRSFP